MNNKKVAIIQSNYIPWKGYFDIIKNVDEFVIFDDMQYTRRDWRNRNKIKTPQGLIWLTIPVKVKNKYNQKIFDTEVNGKEWQVKHWKSIEVNYKKANYFSEVSSFLRPIYLQNEYSHLSSINLALIKIICNYLGIKTKISLSKDYLLKDGKTNRLANLTSDIGGSIYVSGMSAKNYLDEDIFNEMGIKVEWFNYSNYPVYDQLWDGFIHQVSIIDLLFNCGKKSLNYMQQSIEQ